MPLVVSPDPKNWAALFALVVIWGSSFAVTKIAVGDIAPLWVVAYRMVGGAAVLAIVAYWRRVALNLSPRYLAWYLALALIGTVGPFFLITWGVARTDSAIAGILMATVPLFALGLAHLFLPDERLTARKAFGFGLGFVGLFFVIGIDRILAFNDSGGSGFAGEIALTAAAFCYAAHGVIARRAPPMTSVQLALGEIGLGAVIAVAIALVVVPGGFLIGSPAAGVAVTALAVFPTAIAGLILFWLLKRAGVGFVAYCNYLIPVFAAGLGFVAMNEALRPDMLIGLAIILAGIAISESRKMPRGQPDKPPEA